MPESFANRLSLNRLALTCDVVYIACDIKVLSLVMSEDPKNFEIILDLDIF